MVVEKRRVVAHPLRWQRARRGSGDQLREEILDAATDLLLQTGNETAVSIRSVAQHVRVTPPSVYLHFAAKDELMNAVCARHLGRLGEVMLRAAADHTSTIEGLRAQGRAYVRWAVDNPELYRIAVMGRGRPDNDVDRALKSCVSAHLGTSIQTLMTEGIYPQGDPAAVALELWAAAHGVASLLVSRPYLPWGDIEEFADRVMTAACWGHIWPQVWRRGRPDTTEASHRSYSPHEVPRIGRANVEDEVARAKPYWSGTESANASK